jgi:hypothetical protein
MSWTHVYQKSDGAYRGFFLTEADAKAWRRKQEDKKDLVLSDQRPVTTQPADREAVRSVGKGLVVARQVDEAIEAALTATKEAAR